MKQYQEQLNNFNKMLAQNPNNTWALAHRGYTFGLMKDYEKALTDFNRAVALQPDYVWALAHRGEIYCLLAQYDTALADFDQAVVLQPDYAWALAHRGVVYQVKGHLPAALADFNRAVELKPNYTWAIIQRGNVYMALRQYQNALADVDWIIRLDATLIPYWQGERGLILNAMGRYSETITCCKAALKTNQNDYIARYSLVVAKAHLTDCMAELQEEIHETRTLLQTELQTVTNNALKATILYRLGGLNAIEKKKKQALIKLQAAVSLDNEPKGIALHDPAWLALQNDPHFQSLITVNAVS
jgi:tetratricopeptide (TPR) repeat protein